jgi:hypothetical protein
MKIDFLQQLFEKKKKNEGICLRVSCGASAVDVLGAAHSVGKGLNDKSQMELNGGDGGQFEFE